MCIIIIKPIQVECIADSTYNSYIYIYIYIYILYFEMVGLLGVQVHHLHIFSETSAFPIRLGALSLHLCSAVFSTRFVAFSSLHEYQYFCIEMMTF